MHNVCTPRESGGCVRYSQPARMISAPQVGVVTYHLISEETVAGDVSAICSGVGLSLMSSDSRSKVFLFHGIPSFSGEKP